MFQNLNWKQFDWLLLGIVLLLCLLSFAMIYSATMNTELTDLWVRQVGFVAAGMVAVFLVAAFDYRQFSFFAVPAFLLFIASLFAVFLFGEAQGGSKSWISIAGTLVQPTEAGKFLIIIFLAWYLSWFQDRMGRLPYLIAILFLLAAPLALVFIQPDFGMMITYAFLGGALIMVAGVRYRHLLMLLAAALLALPLLAASLQGYMLARLCIFMPTDDQTGQIQKPILDLLRANFDNLPAECVTPEANTAASYNVDQALIAVGNGGLTGMGWLEGSQNQLHFLRVRQTDFIFSVIAEELGLVGASLTLLLLLLIVWRVLRIADRAPDQFGKLLATGVAALIFFQVLINVGFNLKVMPVTGLTLPFISAGGSSLISMMFAIGLAESVAMRQKKTEFY
jgi:rod shape determining protein RodA